MEDDQPKIKKYSITDIRQSNEIIKFKRKWKMTQILVLRNK